MFDFHGQLLRPFRAHIHTSDMGLGMLGGETTLDVDHRPNPKLEHGAMQHTTPYVTVRHTSAPTPLPAREHLTALTAITLAEPATPNAVPDVWGQAQRGASATRAGRDNEHDQG